MPCPRPKSYIVSTLALLVLSASVAACSAESDDPSQPDGEDPSPVFVPPETVTIRLNNAIIRPWDPSEELWDDSQKVSEEEIAALGEALGVPSPYGEVAAFVSGIALDHWAPPDPFGVAEVMVDGAWQEPLTLATRETNIDNTLSPVFDDGWASLPYDDSLRISITLTDEDDTLTGGDDPIGTVVLDADDILDAFEDGGVFQVEVHDQGLGTILFVGITVTEG